MIELIGNVLKFVKENPSLDMLIIGGVCFYLGRQSIIQDWKMFKGRKDK